MLAGQVRQRVALPIKAILQAARDVVQLIAEIVFYCLQIAIQTMNLLVTVVLLRPRPT